MKKVYGARQIQIYLAILTILTLLFSCGRADAHNSKAWEKRINARTVTLWPEGQKIDTMVINARGKLSVTWLERSLTRPLNKDRDVDDWVIDGLSCYSSSRDEVREKVKERDVFVLNYRAAKAWQFNPTKLVINGYAVKEEDVLTRKVYWEDELAAGDEGTVIVCAPSLKAKSKASIRYDDAEDVLEVPGK